MTSRVLPYPQRRALAVRVAKGIEYEARRAHVGSMRALRRLARFLETNEAVVRALQNPAKRMPPSWRVRSGLQTLSKGWPGGPIYAWEWIPAKGPRT